MAEITGVRLEGHDGYDRIVFDVDGDLPPDLGDSVVLNADSNECTKPDGVEDGTLVWWGSVPLGLASIFDDVEATGDTSLVRVVYPGCAVWDGQGGGQSSFGIELDRPGLTFPDPDGDRTGKLGVGRCLLDDVHQIQLDVFVWPGPDGTLPNDEICPPLPG